jgi:hypothetical protein
MMHGSVQAGLYELGSEKKQMALITFPAFIANNSKLVIA